MSSYKYTNFKILEASGVDTKKFLQGLTTADLNLLSTNNDTLLTAFANLKGRIISLCFVKYISEEKLLLSVKEDVLEALLSWLKKYSMFSKVTFTISDEYALFYTTDKGFLNHSILENNALADDITCTDVQKANILNKLPIINKDNIEKFLPAEFDLDNVENVICYTKGCYMGQEVIARMHYKAKTKKELVVVKSADKIDTLDLRSKEDKPLANVVNSVFINNESYMLAVFHNKATESQYELSTGAVITKC